MDLAFESSYFGCPPRHFNDQSDRVLKISEIHDAAW